MLRIRLEVYKPVWVSLLIGEAGGGYITINRAAFGLASLEMPHTKCIRGAFHWFHRRLHGQVHLQSKEQRGFLDLLPVEASRPLPGAGLSLPGMSA